MKTMHKIIIGTTAMAIAAGFFVTGCHKTDPQKYLSYAETAGKTVGYVVNLADNFTDKDVKAHVSAFLGKALPLIPTELTPATVRDELGKVKDAVLAQMEIPESLKPMVNTAIDVLLDFAYVGLDKIAAKYETECANVSTYYSIVHTFMVAVDNTLGRLKLAPPANERGTKDLYAYDSAVEALGDDLNKEDYEELVEALLKK